MFQKLLRWSLAALLACAIPLGASAAPAWWVDGFDGYAAGPLVPQGGWESYFSGSYNISVDPSCARRGTNGIFVDSGPVVKVVSGFASGKYAFHASVNLANTGPFPQRGRIMLLNQYVSSEDYSLWLDINQTSISWQSSGPLQGSGGVPIGGGPGSLTLPSGWADVVCVVDLSGNLAETYVNGQLLARHPWKGESLSLPQIEAVMVSFPGGRAVCMDDFCIVPYRPRVLRRGLVDNFATTNEAAFRSEALNTWFNTSPWKPFDDATGNKHVGVSWTGLPADCGIFDAQLKTRMQASASGSNNDVIYMGLQAPTTPYMAWAATIANLTPTSGGTWNVGDTAKTFAFDLDNMPAGISIPAGMNLLSFPQGGSFDMLVQDDSKVDWAELKLWTCCPWWSGIQFDVVGNAIASLQQPGDALRLSLTNSGQGVAFELGEARSVGVEISTDISVLGRSVTFTTEGSINRQDTGTLATVTVTGVGNGSARLDYDFTGLGATQVRLRTVTQSGQILSTTTGPASGFGPDVPFCSRWYYTENWDPVTHAFIARKICLDHPADPYLVIEPVDPGVENTDDVHMQRQTVTGAGMSQLVIPRVDVSGLDIGQAGFTISPDAYLHPYDNVTVVDNLINAGIDGVSFDFGDSDSWTVNVHAVGGDGGPPLASILETRLTGSYDNQANHAIGSIYQTYDASGSNLSSNFSPVNSTSVRVRALRNGAVLADVASVPSGTLGRLNSLVRGAEFDCRDGSTIGLAFPQTVTYVLDGISRVVDRIELTPNTPGHTVTRVRRLNLFGGNLGEFTVAKADSTHPVRGRVILGDFGQPTGIPVAVEIRAPGSQNPLETHTVTLGEDADCDFETAISGPIEISVKGSHWLRKTFPTFVSQAGLRSWVITLTNGDCDDDNENSIGDFAILSSSYNKCDGDAGFDGRSDLNGDGCTDIADYAILSANYGLFGDN